MAYLEENKILYLCFVFGILWYTKYKPLLQATKQQIITIIIIIIIISIISIMALISDLISIHTHFTLQYSPTFYPLNGEQWELSESENFQMIIMLIY